MDCVTSAPWTLLWYGTSKYSKNIRVLYYLVEMFYLNTIEQLFLFVEQLDQLEVYLPYSRLLTGTPILAEFQNLRWNSIKTSLFCKRAFLECI